MHRVCSQVVSVGDTCPHATQGLSHGFLTCGSTDLTSNLSHMENPSSIRIQRFLLPLDPEGGLGPLLYLLFAEDMKNHIEAGLQTFPDDTLLYGIGLTERQCAAEIQPSLDSGDGKLL